MTLLSKYEDSYNQIMENMAESDTLPWSCSPTYIFGISNKFRDRLQKVCLTIDKRNLTK